MAYQSADLPSVKSSRIDLETVLGHFRRNHSSNVSDFFMLDYEPGFISVLGKDHEGPEFKALVQHLAEVLDRLHIEFPNARWTFYEIPNINYYVDDPDSKTGKVSWLDASQPIRDREFARLEAMRPVLERMDWFAPCLYDWRSNQVLKDRGSPETIKAEFLWRKSLVEATRAYIDQSSRRNRPLLPMVHTRWVDRGSGSGGDYGVFIPMGEFLLDQIEPAVEGGADGITFWSSDTGAIRRAFGPREQDLKRQLRTRQALKSGSGLMKINWNSKIDRQRITEAISQQETARILKTREAFQNLSPQTEETAGKDS